MNCEPGDLAVICRGLTPEELPALGHICTVIRRAIDHPINGRPSWEISPPVFIEQLGEFTCVADDTLKPLRPGDGEDETFSWAGKPQWVTA
jgi:hypothetical protein